MIKQQAGRLTGINEQVASLSPHRLNTNTQDDSHSGEKKLQSCRHTGVTQKTTSLLPHRQQKLRACRHTGVTQNYNLAAPQA